MNTIVFWCNQNQGFIMAVLTFIYVATTIFIWRSNKKTADIASKQLEEMAMERISKGGQPFLVADELTFEIDRPRFFYTPPQDEYSFDSLFGLSSKICNLSSEPALFVDYLASLEVSNNTIQINFDTIARRNNFISQNNMSVNQFTSLPFIDHNASILFTALRDRFNNKHPKLEFIIYYRNASGAYFKSASFYYVFLHKEYIEILCNWHALVTQAPVKYKEKIEFLQRTLTSNHTIWRSTFDQISQDFIKDLGDCEKIALALREIPEEYELKQINEKEYLEATIKYSITYNCPVND